MTNERVIVYRLLDYGDVMVFDEIEGLRGRPTEGLPGRPLRRDRGGSGPLESDDPLRDGAPGLAARATKGTFSVESTITVYPTDVWRRTCPGDGLDLKALEERLLAPQDPLRGTPARARAGRAEPRADSLAR